MNNLDKYYRVYATVNLDAIYKNVANLKANTKKNTKLIAVIKTDGYGHGAVPVARTIDELVDGYAVATIDEGVNLRKNGLTKPICILGYTHESQFARAVKYDIRPAIFEFDSAKKLSDVAVREGKKAKIHIAVDTGMSRIGFQIKEESVDIIEKISKLEGIDIEGIFTHFFASDELDKNSAYEQYNKFYDINKKLKDRGLDIKVKHCSNSAAIIDMQDVNMDCVRAGIAMYGMYPSDEVNKQKVILYPAMELKSHVVYVKDIEAGTGVSYGATFVSDKKMRIATIPVGYGDGYRRSLSGKGSVIIKGMRAPILGRVCMDQFMVDVTHIPDVKAGDEVTLMGRDGNETISAEELADMAKETFNYELVCDFGKRIPRVFYRDGKIVGTKDYFCDIYETE